MTRNNKIDTPGRNVRGQYNTSGYQNTSRKSESNKFMRGFSRTKTKLHNTDFDSAYYMLKHEQRIYVASTAGAIVTGFSNAWDKIWEYGHTKGNMKDLVAGQETALGLITCNMLQIAFDLMIQSITRAYLPVLTESDAGGYWTQTTFDNFVNQLEGTPMPTFVANFVKKFAFVIKLADAYQLHSVEVPPVYVMPFDTNATAAFAQARKLIVLANLANGIAQAEKYGIPMTKFSASMLDHVEITDEHPDARAFFNHVQYAFYAGEVVYLSPSGRMGTKATSDDAALNMTTDYSTRKYFFPNDGPDSIIDAFAPLLGTYGATDNLNGGWFQDLDLIDAASEVSIVHAAHYDTAFTQGTKATLDWYMLMLLATWKGIPITDETPPSFVLNINTDVGASVVGISDELLWPYANYHDLYYGTGITYTQSLEFLLSNLVKLVYG